MAYLTRKDNSFISEHFFSDGNNIISYRHVEQIASLMPHALTDTHIHQWDNSVNYYVNTKCGIRITSLFLKANLNLTFCKDCWA